MEFGWHEVRLTEKGRKSDPMLGAAGSAFPIFHWHRDTFSLPEGAIHMAVSDMTAHQAYRIGRAIYGTQFHFEADTKLVVDWNETLSDMIAEFDPEWPSEFPATFATFGGCCRQGWRCPRTCMDQSDLARMPKKLPANNTSSR
jgi:hypothetical protein